MTSLGFPESDDRLQKARQSLALEEHACRCVARIFVNGTEKGTGFLLSDNWFVTCQHVLPDAKSASSPKSIAQFDYGMRSDGTIPSIEFHFDASTFYSSPCDGGDDWTLIKLKPHPVRGLASILYEGGLSLADDVGVTVGDRLAIVQHPEATLKKTVVSRVTELPPARIGHDVDTAGGSSGSPIFNDHWQVVGIHRLRRENFLKEGIHIGTVIQGIKSFGLWPLRSPALEIYDERGPMSVDSPWYITREADRLAFSHFEKQRGITLALKGPPQLGKSSLAARLEASLLNKNWQSATVDLRADFNEADFADAPTFFRCLARRILDHTGGPDAAMAVFERDRTPNSLASFFNELDRDDSRPLLLILDRVEVLTGKGSCSPVLTGLRVVHNAQGRLGKRAWLKMILITTIKYKQRGPDGSIFDVAKQVSMADFDLPELHQLISLYGNLSVDAERLLAFLGGHPAFTRQALNQLADSGGTFDDLVQAAQADGDIFRDHLDRIVAGFRESPHGRELALAFRELVKGRPLDSEEVFEALNALGVLHGTDAATASSRCLLYSHWLPSHLPR